MPTPMQASTPPVNAPMNGFDMPCSASNAAPATSAPAGAENGADGQFCAPPELLHFVRSGSVRDAANALQLSLGTVHQLRAGYWPRDARRVMRAWSTYKGRVGRVASSWFLRRVRDGGRIAHAGRQWACAGLSAHVGELVAVARMPDGGLLAQTLELPAQRLPLEPAP